MIERSMRTLKIPCKIENGVLIFTDENPTHFILIEAYAEDIEGKRCGCGDMSIRVTAIDKLEACDEEIHSHLEKAPRFVKIECVDPDLHISAYPLWQQKILYRIPISATK